MRIVVGRKTVSVCCKREREQFVFFSGGQSSSTLLDKPCSLWARRALARDAVEPAGARPPARWLAWWDSLTWSVLRARLGGFLTTPWTLLSEVVTIAVAVGPGPLLSAKRQLRRLSRRPVR